MRPSSLQVRKKRKENVNNKKKRIHCAPQENSLWFVCVSASDESVAVVLFFPSAVGWRRNPASCRKVTSAEQTLTNTEVHAGASAAPPGGGV